jgi:hypothetical protein
MATRAGRWCARRWSWATTHLGSDRGSETVDKVLWVAVVIVVVGGIGLLFRDAVESFFNSLVFEIGFGNN